MPKREITNYRKIIVAFLILIIAVFFAFKLSNIISIIFQVAINKNIELKKDDDHLNLLLFGIGGGKHEGPDLTDTIIFSSISLKDNKITLVSIPRDLWSADLNHKINFAYSIGEEKRRSGGITLARSLFEKITGQKINYIVVVNFSGFVRAVDLLGGLSINIDRSFDDYQYPIEGMENDNCGHSDEDIKNFTATTSAEMDLNQYFSCRFIHVHFDQGLTHMDGTTALEFVRSRHAQGEEGTDFARSQRQEKVLKAMKDKALSLNILLNPFKLLSLYDTLKQSIDTDIQNSEIDDFIRLSQKLRTAKIQSVVIDWGDENTKRSGLLIHPPISDKYNFEWVLVPRAGENNYSEIRNYISCEISSGNCSIK